MAAGEFVLTEAVLDGYPYDFVAHGRFSKFENTGIYGSWISGIVVKQDVSVQLTLGESELPHSTMFGNVPVNMYVDGQPRLITQGSGDHRVIVTLDGFNVEIFFVSTGIHVKVIVGPGETFNWATIPGSFGKFNALTTTSVISKIKTETDSSPSSSFIRQQPLIFACPTTTTESLMSRVSWATTTGIRRTTGLT